MKSMVLAVLVALAVTASIASAGIASLASGVSVLIDASSHSAWHDNTITNLSRPNAGNDGDA